MSDVGSQQATPAAKKKDEKKVSSQKQYKQTATAFNAWRDAYGGGGDSNSMVFIAGKSDQGNPIQMNIPDPHHTFRFPFCFNDTCKFAHMTPPKLSYCSKCPKGLRAQYCSVECQRLEWPSHKSYCRLKTYEERFALDKARLDAHTHVAE